MKRLCLFLCSFLLACEPIGKTPTEGTQAISDTEVDPSTDLAIDEEVDTETPTTTQPEMFNNLAIALRVQYVDQVLDTFQKLYLQIDDEKCNLSETLAISDTYEITTEVIEAAFTNILAKIEACQGTGADLVKIKASDLYDFEERIRAALGANVVKACIVNADCARISHGGYLVEAGQLGPLYSKRIQKSEIAFIDAKIRNLMTHLAPSSKTDYTDFVVSTADLPNPLPVPTCLNNVCKNVSP